MYLRTILIVLVLALVVIFALLNWSVFNAPTTLSIGFTKVEAPLGLILLGAIGVLTVLFLIYLVYLQATALVESRQYSRELKAQREIAERAEESRFTQLRSSLESDLRELKNQIVESKSAATARLDSLDRDLRSAIEQSTNSLSAYIAEVEDRLDRASGKPEEMGRKA